MQMKKTKKTDAITSIKKELAKVKINPALDSLKDAPFIKKKMAKGAKMLAAAGLPK